MKKLQQHDLVDILDYDQDTGIFRWSISSPFRNLVGSIAGCICGHGYRIITISGVIYPAHRLAWFYVNGVWPKDQIDHINGVRSDNKINNLRLATHAQNQQNKGLGKNNSTGFKGVSLEKAGRFRARIQTRYGHISLGTFKSGEHAAAAYRIASAAIHGEFARS